MNDLSIYCLWGRLSNVHHVFSLHFMVLISYEVFFFCLWRFLSISAKKKGQKKIGNSCQVQVVKCTESGWYGVHFPHTCFYCAVF